MTRLWIYEHWPLSANATLIALVVMLIVVSLVGTWLQAKAMAETPQKDRHD